MADKNNVRLHYALATNKQNKQGAVPGGKAVAKNTSTVKNSK